MIRILIVDERPEVRRGLQMRLGIEPDMTSIGETGHLDEALRMAQALQPDVIVIDVGRQAESGVDSILQLRKAAPAAAIIVLTLSSDDNTRSRAQEAGIQAFLEKHGGAADLLQAIRHLAERQTGAVEHSVPSPLAMRRPSVG